VCRVCEWPILAENRWAHAGRQLTTGTNIEGLNTPYRAPRANAISERFLGSLRRECLDFCLIFSERQLHRIVNEYVRCFNLGRPHKGIRQFMPCPTEPRPFTGAVASRPVLTGLHYHCYHRQAA
jgi:putative transposase